MDYYRRCYRYKHGAQGRRKHKFTRYCMNGYETDSQTGERLNNQRCTNWSGRCSLLKPRKKNEVSEPSWAENMI